MNSCCQLDETILFDGPVHSKSNGPVDALTQPDLVMCLRARTVFVHLRTFYILQTSLHYPCAATCKNTDLCSSTLDSILSEALYNSEIKDSDAGLFGPWVDAVGVVLGRSCRIYRLCDPVMAPVYVGLTRDDFSARYSRFEGVGAGGAHVRVGAVRLLW